MHSSRELAYEKLQKANMFLRKMEQRKETELLKWKQKRDAQKPRELSACRPAKSQRQPRSAFHMKSNWTIGECLKGYNDKNLKLELVTINVQVGYSLDNCVEHSLQMFESPVRSIFSQRNWPIIMQYGPSLSMCDQNPA